MRNLRFVRSVLAHTGCADCGLKDAAVLEFDHTRDKATTVAELAWAEAQNADGRSRRKS